MCPGDTRYSHPAYLLSPQQGNSNRKVLRAPGSRETVESFAQQLPWLSSSPHLAWLVPWTGVAFPVADTASSYNISFPTPLCPQYRLMSYLRATVHIDPLPGVVFPSLYRILLCPKSQLKHTCHLLGKHHCCPPYPSLPFQTLEALGIPVSRPDLSFCHPTLCQINHLSFPTQA